jgi:predicted short-subunit dehydrogenase-like oxidoreductase (DUF2520 family)
MVINNNIKDRVAILGPGKVGTAVGFLLRMADYRIVSVAGRSDESARKALPYTGGTAFALVAEAAAQADCILITTPDDAIRTVCETISKEAIGPGSKVIHMSGAGGLDLLESARQAGASVGSIHPIQSFADVRGAINTIPGSAFGITVDESIRDWAVQFVGDLGGRPFFVSEADKPLYHAAACMASNYLVTLMHTVETLYGTLGFGREEAVRAFWPLVKGSLANIEAKGTVQSLTGPIARGDVGTIEKHLRVLSEKTPDLYDLYCVNGIHTADIAVVKGTLSEDRAEEIKTLLKRRRRNEHGGQTE